MKKTTGELSGEPRIHAGWVLLLLGLVCCVAFWPAFQCNFVNWDDNNFVVNNSLIRSLEPSAIGRLFLTLTDGNYIPLTLLSFSLNHAACGLNPICYHATNILLHVLNAGMVFLLIRFLVKNTSTALFVSLLFAVHPLRVESVVWVSQRKDVLYLFFYLAALLTYLRYAEKGERTAYVTALLLFGASLLSKQLAVSFPLILVALDYFIFNRRGKRLWVDKVPFLMLSAILTITAVIGQHRKTALNTGPEFTVPHRILLAGRSFVFYLEKTFMPVNLSALYPYPDSVLPVTLPYLPFAIVLLGLLLWAARRDRYRKFAVAFFLITILPILNLIPAGAQMRADRFIYLPSIGLALLIALLIKDLLSRASPASHPGTKLMVGLTCVMVVVLVPVTYLRATVWENSETLWRDVLKNRPDSLIAWNNLSTYLLEHGRYEEALEGFDRADSIVPDLVDTLANRGLTKMRLGRFEDAVDDLSRSLAVDADFGPALFNRAEAFYEMGEYWFADADYTRAIEAGQNTPEAWFARGVCRGVLGQFAGAVQDLTRALELEPGWADAHYNRGKAYFNLNEFARALDDFNRAIMLDPSYAKAFYHRAHVYIETRRYEEAMNDLLSVRELGFTIDTNVWQRVAAELDAREE
ncbi:MAG: tetratricopeptide repeat protein [Verrucomicrobia bacterium]|nr:tetratricopeptide repeat protein [Verrucomicrobiota bacterium]